MLRKDEYNDSYYKIIEKVNKRHTDIERKKFERTINNRNVNGILMILALILVVAMVIIFVMIGFQPYDDTALAKFTTDLFSSHAPADFIICS